MAIAAPSGSGASGDDAIRYRHGHRSRWVNAGAHQKSRVYPPKCTAGRITRMVASAATSTSHLRITITPPLRSEAVGVDVHRHRHEYRSRCVNAEAEQKPRVRPQNCTAGRITRMVARAATSTSHLRMAIAAPSGIGAAGDDAHRYRHGHRSRCVNAEAEQKSRGYPQNYTAPGVARLRTCDDLNL